MNKLSHEVAGAWVLHSYPPMFAIASTGSTERMEVGVPGGDATVLKKLLECLSGPFFVLYVLHTPRGEGEPGRYQSPPLEAARLADFIDRHAAYLAGDARHDFWVHSPDDNATLVWDRHNMMFTYGPLDCFKAKLTALGFDEGVLPVLGTHQHHYRAEFDAIAGSILSALEWRLSPLRPEDVQFQG